MSPVYAQNINNQMSRQTNTTRMLEYNIIANHIVKNKQRQKRIGEIIVETEKKRAFAIQQYRLIVQENDTLEKRLRRLEQRHNHVHKHVQKKRSPTKVRFGGVEERIYYVDREMRKLHTKKRKRRK